jgi:asparagine synthase (glutamine-hydrolysing)
MERYIPREITQATKQGFSAPDASWFKGESLDYVREKLFHPRAMIYEYLDQETIHDLINEHLSGKMNRRLLIWSLLNVENWCEQFLGKKHLN